ncbi:hypothetical protein HDV00_008410 [Rhizophlyctis rosea]|nr:hypothetical protein HDV00_008410 [Rhizophlyctis rosea]
MSLSFCLLLLALLSQHGFCRPYQTGTRTSYQKQTKYSQLVTYGDSWTDNGNVYKLTKGQWPTSAYYKGHFSDGPIWCEYVAQDLGVNLVDHAYGGATTDSHLVQGYTGADSTIPVPSIADQLTSPTTPRTHPKTLYIFWGGGNDFFFNSSLTGATIANALFTSVKTLSQTLPNPSKVAILNLPPLQILPYFANNPVAASLFGNLAKDFNTALSNLVNTHNRDKKNHPVILIDIFSQFTSLIRPFADKSDACWEGGVTGTRTCEDYVFVDEFHFTTKMHKAIADIVLQKI